MRDLIIVSAFVLALVATLTYQLFTHRLARWVWRWDVFRLLPSYRLFSAIPRDLRLYYCDRLHDGAVTPWRELRIGLFGRWSAWHAVWHPQHLVPSVYAALTDDVARLAETRNEAPEPASLANTASYRGLAHAVRRVPHEADADATQFKIEEAAGHRSTRPARVVFVSLFHAL